MYSLFEPKKVNCTQATMMVFGGDDDERVKQKGKNAHHANVRHKRKCERYVCMELCTLYACAK